MRNINNAEYQLYTSTGLVDLIFKVNESLHKQPAFKFSAQFINSIYKFKD